MAGNNCIATSIASVNTFNGVTVYNQPNPSIDHMDIVYTLPTDSRVEAVLYDEYGREVQTLFSNYSNSGTHTESVDTHHLSAGLYFYTLRGDYFSTTRKCLIVK